MNWSEELFQAGLSASVEALPIERYAERTGRPLGNRTYRVRITSLKDGSIIAESLQSMRIMDSAPIGSLFLSCAMKASHHPVLRHLLQKYRQEQGEGVVSLDQEGGIDHCFNLIEEALNRSTDHPVTKLLAQTLKQLRDEDRTMLAQATRRVLSKLQGESLTRKYVAFAIERTWFAASIEMSKAHKARKGSETTARHNQYGFILDCLEYAVDALPKQVWKWVVATPLIEQASAQADEVPLQHELNLFVSNAS